MCLNDLSGCELVTFASIFAITIAKNLSDDEINILGDFFSAVGDNLSLIGSYSGQENIEIENS